MNNTGLLTNEGQSIELARLETYWSGKHALIAQGGGQKGIFTAGVLDALLQMKLDPFDSFYGTSAGALNIMAFLCRQSEFSKDFYQQITTQKEFFSFFRRRSNRSALDLDWAFNNLAKPPFLLDLELGRFALGQRQAYATVTNRKTLQDEYLPIICDDWLVRLKASSAIPSLYEHNVPINGELYVDGGVSAAIPVQQAWRDGARLITVIRTEPFDSKEEIDSYGGIERQLNVQAKKSRSSKYLRVMIEKFIARKQLALSAAEQELSNTQVQNFTTKNHLQITAKLLKDKNIYRLGSLFGKNFESGMMDMLAVHYQTYQHSIHFIEHPPEDCFVLQIAPQHGLRSKPLSSKPEDLIYDYEQGLKAGERYAKLIQAMHSS